MIPASTKHQRHKCRTPVDYTDGIMIMRWLGYTKARYPPQGWEECRCVTCTTLRWLIRGARRGFSPRALLDKHPDIRDFFMQYLDHTSKAHTPYVYKRPPTQAYKQDKYHPINDALEWSNATFDLPTNATKKSSANIGLAIERYINNCFFCHEPLPAVDRFLLSDPVSHMHAIVACRACANDHLNVQECQNCGRTFYRSPRIGEGLPYADPDTGSLICGDCLSTMRHCGNCGRYRNHGTNCQCRDNEGLVNRWDYKPAFFYLSSSNERRLRETLLTGFEIEVGFGSRKSHDNAAAVVHNALNFYTVYDGSITRPPVTRDPDTAHGRYAPAGFEIISMPFTQKFWKQEHRLATEKLIISAKEEGAQAWPYDTCGFHIHLSRASFSDTQLFKFIALIHRNTKFIHMMAQRDPSDHFDRYTSLSREGKTDKEILAKIKRARRMRELRYVGVNTTGERTVELRFFKASLNMHNVLKNMEFAWSLFEWSARAPLTSPDLVGYMKYVDSHRSVYPHLYGFLDAQGKYDNKRSPTKLRQFQTDSTPAKKERV